RWRGAIQLRLSGNDVDLPDGERPLCEVCFRTAAARTHRDGPSCFDRQRKWSNARCFVRGAYGKCPVCMKTPMRCSGVSEASASSTTTAMTMRARARIQSAIERSACAFCAGCVVGVADMDTLLFMIVPSCFTNHPAQAGCAAHKCRETTP